MNGCRSYKVAIFAVVLACTSACATNAIACLRPTLDERAIQWSTATVEADLKSIDSVEQPPAHPSQARQTYFFAVKSAIDGTLKNGEVFHVTRTFSADAKPSRCPVSLSGKQQGDRFVLLLRKSETAGEMIIVHMLSRADLDDAAMADLKMRIADVRRAEQAGTDDAIAAQLAALASAVDAVEAEDAERALLGFGPGALPALKRKVDDVDLTDAGRTRIKRVIDELTPPPQPSEPRD